MKKYIVPLFAVLFLFAACNFDSSSDDSSDSSSANSTEQNSSTSNSSQSTESAKNSVTLYNNSGFTVKVYADSLRAEGLCSIEAGQSAQLNAEQTSEGAVYYLTYYVDVGVEVPWYDTNSFVYAKTGASANISAPSSMATKNCYVIIENNSAQSVIFKQGASELYPENNSASTILSSEEAGVYAIKSVYFGNFSSFDITTAGGTSIGFPSQLTAFEAGDIYTITITSDTKPQLKSIAPFNLDTEKQIWSFSDNSTFDLSSPIILRSAYNASDGSLVMGTLSSDSTAVGLKKIDKYNSKSTLYTAQISHDTSVTVKKSIVLDFAQQSDGSVVLLLQNQYAASSGLGSAYFLVGYDFGTKSVKWSYVFPDAMLFRSESRNKIFCTADGNVAIAGAVISASQMKRYFASLNTATRELKQYVSSEYTDFSAGVETMFTSVWSDGVSFYVCGYDNCDFQYSSRVHSGIVYRFSSDLTSAEEIYSYDNALFFCIDGISGDYYICGEYADAGNILKGCYISSALVAQKSAPVKYVSNSRTYCYFSGICCYGNKIIAGGKASDDFAGEANAMPIIAAFDRSSAQVLWENSSFTAYSDLGAIIPNEINTYTVQLRSSGEVHYVSADLLGNEK